MSDMNVPVRGSTTTIPKQVHKMACEAYYKNIPEFARSPDGFNTRELDILLPDWRRLTLEYKRKNLKQK